MKTNEVILYFTDWYKFPRQLRSSFWWIYDPLSLWAGEQHFSLSCPSLQPTKDPEEEADFLYKWQPLAVILHIRKCRPRTVSLHSLYSEKLISLIIHNIHLRNGLKKSKGVIFHRRAFLIFCPFLSNVKVWNPSQDFMRWSQQSSMVQATTSSGYRGLRHRCHPTAASAPLRALDNSLNLSEASVPHP